MDPNAIQGIWLVFSIILGATVGSFLNVCIYRLPWRKSLIWPGSHCPQCWQPVRAYDNVPVLSWFLLRGRCRHCGQHFSARYMFVELLTAVLFGLLFWVIAPDDIPGALRYLCYAFLIGSLLVATFIDLDLQVIPDSVTVPGMIIGLIGSAALPQVPLILVTDLWPSSPMQTGERTIYALDVVVAWGLWLAGIRWMHRQRNDHGCVPEWLILISGAACLVAHSFGVLASWGIVAHRWTGWPIWLEHHPHMQGLWTSVIGLLTGAGMIWVVRVIGSAVMGREAMGFGDVTLMAMVGAFLGWQAIVCVFFIAPFMGLIVGVAQLLLRGSRMLPYGPYLSLAAVITLLGWPVIWPIFGVRLAILGLFGIAWWGSALLVLLLILAVCVRINLRRTYRELAADAATTVANG